MTKPPGKPAVRSAQHQTLIDRERLIVEANAPRGIEQQLAAIAEDRAARWAALRAGLEESADARSWAAKMTVLHGSPNVQIHRNRLDWITALYVVRYGEAEDYWPTSLTADDVRRADRWFLGDRPEGVLSLKGEEV